MSLKDQTDEQLQLALRIGSLNREQREQIHDELMQRGMIRSAEERRLKAAARAKEEAEVAASRKRFRAMTDGQLADHLETPANVAETALIQEEIQRRAKQQRSNTKARATKAAKVAFTTMSHADLLAWTSSGDEAEDRAAVKEMRARVKALDIKWHEVKDGIIAMKPVRQPDDDHDELLRLGRIL